MSQALSSQPSASALLRQPVFSATAVVSASSAAGSHTRSVSSEIVTPSFASDCASSRIDAPARRSASSTSRYGSSAANRRERGRRPSAINRASVWALPVEVPAAPCVVEGKSTGAVVSLARGPAGVAVPSAGDGPVESGARESCSPAAAGASFGFMPANYRVSSGRAMGALRSGSKPPGLDVGVPASSFLWVFVSQFASLRLWLSVRRSIRGWLRFIGLVRVSWFRGKSSVTPSSCPRSVGQSGRFVVLVVRLRVQCVRVECVEVGHGDHSDMQGIQPCPR